VNRCCRAGTGNSCPSRTTTTGLPRIIERVRGNRHWSQDSATVSSANTEIVSTPDVTE
jgi:hypothetical protein